MPIISRQYETDVDLRRMQALQQELWALESERTQAHVGDLAWGATQHVGREREWNRRLWFDGDRCVAWAWLKRPASFDYEVHRDHRGGPLHKEVLDWFESEAQGDEPLHAFVMEGDVTSRELFERRGFVEPDNPERYAYHARNLSDFVANSHEASVLDDGFVLRTVRGDEDLHERVEVHRAVWAPSRVTEESYRNVMRTWPYRADLDCVLEARDGTFAAYVLCWYDDVNRVGEFEPVGTHPDYRRRGFGAAVCRYALQRLKDAGGTKAIVLSATEPAAALYESLGLRQHTHVTELRKER